MLRSIERNLFGFKLKWRSIVRPAAIKIMQVWRSCNVIQRQRRQGLKAWRESKWLGNGMMTRFRLQRETSEGPPQLERRDTEIGYDYQIVNLRRSKTIMPKELTAKELMSKYKTQEKQHSSSKQPLRSKPTRIEPVSAAVANKNPNRLRGL